MKKKDFFEQLNRELENALPPMSERLKDEIIQTSADRLPARCDTRTTTSKRKPSLRFVKIFTAAASIILSFIMLFSLFGRNIFLRGEEFAVMQIDINPSLALTLDEDYRAETRTETFFSKTKPSPSLCRTKARRKRHALSRNAPPQRGIFAFQTRVPRKNTTK